jgi:hypothetical protein
VFRSDDGSIALRLAGRERDVLRTLLGDLELLVGAPSLPEEPWDADERVVASAAPDADADPVASAGDASDPDGATPGDDADPDADDLELADIRARLYPSAAPENPRADESYRRLVHADLEEGRRRRIAVVVETLGARQLDDAQAEAWLATLNDLRLVLGTRLGVTEESELLPEDPDDPDAAARVVYAWTGWLEGQFVDVLAAALPDEIDHHPASAPDEGVREDDS